MESPKESTNSGAANQDHPHAHMTTCQLIKFNMMRLLMELVGTAVFCMIFLASNDNSYVLLLGLWVMTMFAFEISGAQFNPALTLAFIFRRDSIKMPRAIGLLYILFQFLGALAGAEMMNLLRAGKMQALMYCKGWWFQSINSEILTAAIFVFIYLTQTDMDTRFSKDKSITCFLIAIAFVSSRAMFGGAFGNTELACAYGTGSFLGTYGTLANPAFAIAIWFMNITSSADAQADSLWLYPTFPFLGAFLALLFYELIFNRHVQSRAEVAADAYSEPGDLDE